MRVAIGADHAGFALKEATKRFLLEEHCEVLDLGTQSEEPVDYTDFAEAVGAALQGHEADRGVILCGSGVGASMAANKMSGVRAGLCHDTYSAHQGVEHDDMNVLVLGGRIVGPALARELIHAFVNARFSGEPRHLRRLAKLTALANPLRALAIFGQSVWLDHMRRGLIISGELRRMIDEDGLGGVTSNLALLTKAVAGSAEALEGAVARDLDPKHLYETLAIRAVRDAADTLAPVYERTARRDGYVSLEVSPDAADDTAGILEEARRLWRAVERENLMIAVPATPAGITAVGELTSEGINVNATLLFGRERYEEAAGAYISGLERLAARGGDPSRVAGVASVSIGRLDHAFDEQIADRLASTTARRELALLRSLTGKVARATAKLCYQRYQELFAGPRWQALASRGARTQRLLWATAGARSPGHADLASVEELVGPDTVSAMPRATLDTFRERGQPRPRLAEDLDAARDTMATIAALGISVPQATDALLAAEVRAAVDSFGKLLAAVKRQGREAWAKRLNAMTTELPTALAAAVAESLAAWGRQGKVRRLWLRDPSLWSGRDEAHWLGWLAITSGELADVRRFTRIAEIAGSGAFTHVLLLGMGGSSLGPDVLRRTFGRIPGFPALVVLDSTDPAQVRTIEASVDLRRTLFIVSSKSGSTLEPNIFEQYFFDRVAALLGAQEAGRRFVAITDPDSKMQHVAEGEGFRRVFFGWPDIGGRYSVLSDFGLVPAAAMGIDVADLLDRTEAMVAACLPTVPVAENPAVVLGNVLGVAATRFGRDKVTIIASPAFASLGSWLEQLIAESTGKEGRGLIPIDREPTAPPDAYGDDRLFVYLRHSSEPDRSQDHFVEVIARAAHPVVRIALDGPYDLGQEFFRWEMATAVAGSILGIHPFDQPDVEASKTATRRLTAAYEERGALPGESPIFTAGGVSLYTDEVNAAALAGALEGPPSLAAYLAALLGRIRPGDYFALLPYLEMNEENASALGTIREHVLATRHVATCLEFGPRFLHSTGQAYKGGPNTGVFLQITCDDAADLPVPGQRYTFGVVKAAQARGDFEVLVQRGRRALRAHLGPDVTAGLAALQEAILG